MTVIMAAWLADASSAVQFVQDTAMLIPSLEVQGDSVTSCSGWLICKFFPLLTKSALHSQQIFLLQ